MEIFHPTSSQSYSGTISLQRPHHLRRQENALQVWPEGFSFNYFEKCVELEDEMDYICTDF